MPQHKIGYGFSLIVLLAVAFVLFYVWKEPEKSIEFYKEFVNHFPEQTQGAAAILILFYIFGSLLFIPVSVLTLTAGVLFGFILGSLLASLSALAAAIFSFLLGRKFGNSWVLDKFDRRHLYRSLDNAAAREGWKIVLLLRLAPFFPFSAVNFFLGVSKISLPKFVWATWSGMLPGIIVYAYLGSLARDITELSLSQREPSLLEWGLSVLSVLAALVFFLYFTFYAKKTLRRQLHEKEKLS